MFIVQSRAEHVKHMKDSPCKPLVVVRGGSRFFFLGTLAV